MSVKSFLGQKNNYPFSNSEDLYFTHDISLFQIYFLVTKINITNLYLVSQESVQISWDNVQPLPPLIQYVVFTGYYYH